VDNVKYNNFEARVWLHLLFGEIGGQHR
jgi:hypothetical protein